MQKVLFEPIEHKYTEIATGEIIPSVSTILKAVGFGPQNGFKSKAMTVAADRGTEIHEMYNNYILFGTECQNPELQGYMNALKLFEKENNVIPVNGEYQVFGTINGVKVAGTVDYKACKDGKLVIIDFKSTKAIEKYHAYQLAMYAELDDETIEDAYVLQVFPNGSYVLMSANTVAPGCFRMVNRIIDSYTKEEKFNESEELVESKEVKKYVEIAGKIEVLEADQKKCAEKIKALVTCASAKNSMLEVLYKRPSISDKFFEDEFTTSLDDSTSYTGKEIKELIKQYHRLIVGEKGSYSLKVVKPKEEDKKD